AYLHALKNAATCCFRPLTCHVTSDLIAPLTRMGAPAARTLNTGSLADTVARSSAPAVISKFLLFCERPDNAADSLPLLRLRLTASPAPVPTPVSAPTPRSIASRLRHSAQNSVSTSGSPDMPCR